MGRHFVDMLGTMWKDLHAMNDAELAKLSDKLVTEVEAELIFSGLGSSKCLRAHREILRLLLPLNTIRWITVLLALQKYYYASKHLQ